MDASKLTLSSEDVQEMFEFPIRRLYELLMEQWQRARENKVKIKVRILDGLPLYSICLQF